METTKKRGRTPLDVNTRAFTLMLDPEDAETAKDFPGGLSALVRRFLSDVKKSGGAYPNMAGLSEEAAALVEQVEQLPSDLRRSVENLIKALADLSGGGVDVGFECILTFKNGGQRATPPVYARLADVDDIDDSLNKTQPQGPLSHQDVSMLQQAMFAEMVDRDGVDSEED